MSAEAAAADSTGQLMQASADVARVVAASKQVQTILMLLAVNTEPVGSFNRIVKYIRTVARAKGQGVVVNPATIERQVGALMNAHEACNRLSASALEHCHQIGRMVHLAETLDVLKEVGLAILANTRADRGFFAYQSFALPRIFIREFAPFAASIVVGLAMLPANPEPGKALDLFKRVAERLQPELQDVGPFVLSTLTNMLASNYTKGGLLHGVPSGSGVLVTHAAILRWICDDPLSLFRHDFTTVHSVYVLPEQHELLTPFLDALFRSPVVHDARVVAEWRTRVPDERKALFDQYVAMHLPDSRAAAATGDLPNAQKVIVRAFAEANLEYAERRLPSEIVGKVFAHLYHDETPVIVKEGATTSTTPFAQLLTREARNAMFGADLERQAYHDVIGAFQVTDEQQTRALQQPRQVSRWERTVRAREPDDDDENVYGYADDAGTNDDGDADGDADMDGLEQQAANLRVSASASPPTKRGRVAGHAAALAQQQFDW